VVVEREEDKAALEFVTAGDAAGDGDEAASEGP